MNIKTKSLQQREFAIKEKLKLCITKEITLSVQLILEKEHHKVILILRLMNLKENNQNGV